MKKIIALILALWMAVSCTCVTAFAEESTVRQYGKEGGYLALGDSISRGVGSSGDDGVVSTDMDVKYVEGSPTALVADAVGCSMEEGGSFWPACYHGTTLGMMLDLYGIEDDIGYDAYQPILGIYGKLLELYGYEGSVEGVNGESCTGSGTVGSIIDLTEKASLITIELGMNDVFSRPLYVGVFGQIYGSVETDVTPEQIKSVLELMYEGYNNWVKYYPVLLKTIRTLNPYADIVLVSNFNLAADVELTPDTVLPIGDAVAVITGLMNSHLRDWAEEYGVIYADISNAETYAAEKDLSLTECLVGDMDDFFRVVHPSQNGYDYIARQILDALKKKTPTTDISVDLGRLQNVSFVAVNGRQVTDYRMDGFTLTVPYSCRSASNLTVAGAGSDRRIALQSYQLVWSDREGYTAYRIYGTDDAGGLVKKAATAIVRIPVKLFSLLKK